MNDPRHIDEADLHAYVDGLLDESRRREVAAWLAEHPEEATRLTDYQRQNTLLKQALDPVLDEPIPEPLQRAARGKPSARPWRFAAGLGWLAVGVLAGWLARGPQPPAGEPLLVQRLVEPARAAHVVYTLEVLHPVEVDASQEQHLAGWLSKRLGAPVKAPGLSMLGYQLIGGRLLPADDGPAAQFMYESDSGQRLTLYVRRADFDTEQSAFRYDQRDGIGQFYWIDGPLGYALIGSEPRQQLLQAARQVYHQLNI